MKRILLFIIGLGIIVISILFYLAIFRVNQEDLNYISKFPQITPDEIKKEEPNSVIIFIDPACPGAPRFGPKIKKGTDLLDSLKIPYYLIADVLYSKKGDSLLENFIMKYDYLNKPIYLMSIEHFPNNSGLFNARRRLKEFIANTCYKCDTLPYGPGLHIFLKNGQFEKAKLTYELNPKELEIYKK